MPRFSVVVPAHNEEDYLAGCLESIDDAAIVANRCTDRTVALALELGARVVEDASRSIGAVRNAGAKVATGDVVVTLDADSRMSPCAFLEIDRKLATGRYVVSRSFPGTCELGPIPVGMPCGHRRS